MKNKKNVILVISVSLVILLVGYLLAANYYGFFPFSRAVENNPTSNTVKQLSTADDTYTDKKSSTPTSSDVTAQTSDEVALSPNLSVQIIAWQQQNRSVDATATTSGPGTCVFQYTTDGDKPVVRETQSNESKCSSSIPELFFSKLGTWHLKVTYYQENQKAETMRDVTIQ